MEKKKNSHKFCLGVGERNKWVFCIHGGQKFEGVENSLVWLKKK